MKILAFGIHPDDVEIGCGGTVILAVRLGHDVSIVDLSEGRSSTNGTPEERAAESSAAARVMGVTRRYSLRLPDTGIQSENDDHLGVVVECLREERPTLVLAPSADDPHPDHASGGRLIERALYFSGVHGYRRALAAWRVAHVLVYPGRRDFEPAIVVDVTSTHDAKLKAVLAHASQFVAGEGRLPTPLNSPDFMDVVVARARTHGRRIGVRFGEAFRTTGPVKLAGFDVFGG
jgi:bacillithiol biosynthesis deacetylase BshB1